MLDIKDTVMKKRLGFIVFALILLSGCGKQIQSEENSISEPIVDDSQIMENKTNENSIEEPIVDDTRVMEDKTNENSIAEPIVDDTQITEKKTKENVVSEIYGTGYQNWQEAYSSFIVDNDTDTKRYEYSLIYLDNDDQPELFVNTCVEASGERLLSYYDNSLSVLELYRIGSRYIPKSGLVYNGCGHMDYYPVYIEYLSDGDFYKIGEGVWGGLDWDFSKGAVLDENGYPVYQYEWEGVRYTEEEFHEKIEELFKMNDSVYPKEWYKPDEMLLMLKSEE